MCISKAHRPASRVAAHSRARQFLAWGTRSMWQSRGVPGLCTRTIRVTRILLRRGHIPGAGHAVAKALLFRAGSPAGWVGVSTPRRETSTHVPSAIGFSGVAAAEGGSLGGCS